MVVWRMRMLAVAVCLAGVPRADDRPPTGPADDSKAIEGLWSGFWGGGRRGEVVFQPARAELLVKGDHFELDGFRTAGRLTGTVRLDPTAKRIRITPAAE